MTLMVGCRFIYVMMKEHEASKKPVTGALNLTMMSLFEKGEFLSSLSRRAYLSLESINDTSVSSCLFRMFHRDWSRAGGQLGGDGRISCGGFRDRGVVYGGDFQGLDAVGWTSGNETSEGQGAHAKKGSTAGQRIR